MWTFEIEIWEKMKKCIEDEDEYDYKENEDVIKTEK